MTKFKETFVSKKIAYGMLGALLVLLLTITFCQPAINIFIDGKQVPLTDSTGRPQLSNNTTLVPMRVVSEYLGYKIDWNPSSKLVTITGDGTEIKLTIGNKTAFVNGKPETLLAAPQVVNNRTLVPFRFVGETFGYTVKWDAETHSVIFRSKGYEGPDMKEKPKQEIQGKEIHEVLKVSPNVENILPLYANKDGHIIVNNSTLPQGAVISANDANLTTVTVTGVKLSAKDILTVTAITGTTNPRAIIVVGVKKGVTATRSYQSDFIYPQTGGKAQFTFHADTDFNELKSCEQLLFIGDNGTSVLVPNPLYQGR